MPVRPQKKARREDWRARAKEMRADFRDEFSNANRTQYYVGDPDPSLSFDSSRGGGQASHLANKLAQRGDARNHALWAMVQQKQDAFRPGTNPNEKLGGPEGPEPTPTGAMPAPPPETPPVSASAAGPYGSADPYSALRETGYGPSGSAQSLLPPTDPQGILAKLYGYFPTGGFPANGTANASYAQGSATGPYTPPKMGPGDFMRPRRRRRR